MPKGYFKRIISTDADREREEQERQEFIRNRPNFDISHVKKMLVRMFYVELLEIAKIKSMSERNRQANMWFDYAISEMLDIGDFYPEQYQRHLMSEAVLCPATILKEVRLGRDTRTYNVITR